MELAARYPTVTVASAGRSFEGRDIKYLKISTTNFQVKLSYKNQIVLLLFISSKSEFKSLGYFKFQDTSKPVIMIQSLLHAREWVTLPPSLYAIEKLVVDVTDRDLVDNIDWIILPIANPDGYEFSHTNVSCQFLFLDGL